MNGNERTYSSKGSRRAAETCVGETEGKTRRLGLLCSGGLGLAFPLRFCRLSLWVFFFFFFLRRLSHRHRGFFYFFFYSFFSFHCSGEWRESRWEETVRGGGGFDRRAVAEGRRGRCGGTVHPGTSLLNTAGNSRGECTKWPGLTRARGFPSAYLFSKIQPKLV